MKSRAPRFHVAPAPHTFGGQPTPSVLARCASDAPRRFAQYFTERLEDPRERRRYAVAITHLCDVASGDRLELWELTPMYLSIYLEKLQLRGMGLEEVRLHWRAIGVLFDWLCGARVVPVNAVVSVPDPAVGYSWPEPTADAPADDGTIDIPVGENARP